MKTTFISAIALIFTTALHAQGPSPAEQRLREQIKTLTQRVTTAETASATLQSEKTALDEDVKKQKALLEKLVKESNAEKDAMKAEAEKLKADITDREKQLADKGAELTKEKDFNVKLSAVQQKTEAERARLENESNVLKRIVSDQRLKNSQMLATAKDVLDRYAKFGLGTALTAREPFVGVTRARLESYFEEYTSLLSKHRIRLDGTTPKTGDAKPAVKKPAAKP